MADFFHDGCDGCKYEMHYDVDFPCSQCKGTTLPSSDEYKTRLDLWEPMPEQKSETENDVVNHPSHYAHGGIECCSSLNVDGEIYSNNVQLYSGIKKMSGIIGAEPEFKPTYYDESKIDKSRCYIEYGGITFLQIGDERTSTTAKFTFR